MDARTKRTYWAICLPFFALPILITFLGLSWLAHRPGDTDQAVMQRADTVTWLAIGMMMLTAVCMPLQCSLASWLLRRLMKSSAAPDA